jgi:hypothetical protein
MNCPRCIIGIFEEKNNGIRCLNCGMNKGIYFKAYWVKIGRYYVEWEVGINKSIIMINDNGTEVIDLPLLPYDITIERIEKLILL